MLSQNSVRFNRICEYDQPKIRPYEFDFADGGCIVWKIWFTQPGHLLSNIFHVERFHPDIFAFFRNFWLNLSLLILILFVVPQFVPMATAQSLEDLLEEYEEIVVVTSVSRVEERQSRAPSVVDVITHDQIRERGYRTIYDVLLHTPGFWPIQDVNDKLVGVRGVHASTSQKFLLLINGRRITENLWNLTDIDYNISLTNVKRVEIIRGPGSAIYGRAALTAVINVVTFSGKELDGLHGHVSLGNFGYRNLGFSYGQKMGDNGDLQIFGHMMAAEGQEFDIDAAEDGATHRVDGQEIIDRFKSPTGGLGIILQHRDWHLNIFLQGRFYQPPRAAGAELNWQTLENNDYHGDLYKDRLLGEAHEYGVVDLQRAFRLGSVENSVTLNYTYSKLRLRENSKPLRDVEIPADWTDRQLREYGLGEMFEFDIESYRIGIEYFGQMNWDEQTQGLWGFEAYQTVPYSDKFSANYISHVDSTTNQLVKIPTEGGYYREKPDGTFDKLRQEQLYSAFGEVKYSANANVHLSLGTRYDVHVKGDDYRQENEQDRYPDPEAEAKRADIDKTSAQLSPRLALIFQPFANERLTLKALYSKSFIAPGYFYRYADPSTSYAGGPWLKAETLDNYMFVVEGMVSAVRARALYFRNINKDLLTRDTSLTPARYTSLGKLAMHGVEMDATYRQASFALFANYAFMKGLPSASDDVSARSWIMDDDSIKNFPIHSGTVGVTGFFLRNQLSATVQTRWHGAIQSPVGAGIGAGTIEELDAAAQFGLTLRYTPPKHDDLDITLSIYNVLDEEIWLGGTVKRPYHQPGRWLNVSVVKRL